MFRCCTEQADCTRRAHLGPNASIGAAVGIVIASCTVDMSVLHGHRTGRKKMANGLTNLGLPNRNRPTKTEVHRAPRRQKSASTQTEVLSALVTTVEVLINVTGRSWRRSKRAHCTSATLNGSNYRAIKRSSDWAIKLSRNQAVKQSSHRAIKQSRNQTIEPSSHQTIKHWSHHFFLRFHCDGDDRKTFKAERLKIHGTPAAVSWEIPFYRPNERTLLTTCTATAEVSTVVLTFKFGFLNHPCSYSSIALFILLTATLLPKAKSRTCKVAFTFRAF